MNFFEQANLSLWKGNKAIYLNSNAAEFQLNEKNLFWCTISMTQSRLISLSLCLLSSARVFEVKTPLLRLVMLPKLDILISKTSSYYYTEEEREEKFSYSIMQSRGCHGFCSRPAHQNSNHSGKHNSRQIITSLVVICQAIQFQESQWMKTLNTLVFYPMRHQTSDGLIYNITNMTGL